MRLWCMFKRYCHLRRWLNRLRYAKRIRHLEKWVGSKTIADFRLRQLLDVSHRLLQEHPSSLSELEKRLKQSQSLCDHEGEARIAAVLLHLEETHVLGDLHRARSIRRQYHDHGDGFIREQLHAAKIDPICIASVMAELDPEIVRAESVALAQWQMLPDGDRQPKEQHLAQMLQDAHFPFKVAQAAVKAAVAHHRRDLNEKN